MKTLETEFDVIVWLQVFNNEDTLTRTLESILNQKGCKYQIVAYDDGSSDKSLRILRDFQKQFSHLIHVVRSSQNSLEVGNFSEKIQSINPFRSKYVAFIDGDDEWTDENKLAKTIVRMELDGAVLGFHKVHFVTHPGELSTSHSLQFAYGIHSGKKRFLRSIQVGSLAIPTCSMVVRRDVVNRKMCLPTNNLIGQDFILKALALDTGSFSFLNESMAKMRVRQDSMWSPNTFLWKLRRTFSLVSFVLKFVRTRTRASLVWYLVSWGTYVAFSGLSK